MPRNRQLQAELFFAGGANALFETKRLTNRMYLKLGRLENADWQRTLAGLVKGERVSCYLVLQLDDLFLDGVFYQFPPIMQVQLLHQAVAVRLNGFNSQIEQLGNFTARVTFGN